MKLNRDLVIHGNEFSLLFEELMDLIGDELSGPDGRTQEDEAFIKDHPQIYKLFRILQSELIKEQSTYHYGGATPLDEPVETVEETQEKASGC